MSVKLINSSKQILTLLLLCITFNVAAIEVDNLYTGKILVTDKTQKTRVKAHKWAIEQVLAKVTGNREILKDKTVQREIRLRTANYIKSFTFVTDDQKRTFLVDEFDQNKIDTLLRKAGASIWGKRRPKTLVWLVIEEGINRSIVRNELHPQLSEMILQSSDNRGVPVVLPLMTQQESNKIYSSDIWARFENVVARASQPYDVENYVMARMRYLGNTDEAGRTGWLLEYQLMKEQDVLKVGQFNGEQFEVIRDMSNDIGDYYASQYAIKSEKLGADSIHISIMGISNVANLVAAENYLKSLPPVSHVEMKQLSKNSAEFELALSGEGLDVVKALALLPEFQQIIDTDGHEEQVTLSVEAQLDKLIQDYYRQVKPLEKGETGDEAPPSNTHVRLVYTWLGNA